MIAAGIVCLLLGEAVLGYFWARVARSYGDQPVPILQWVPSYPPGSVRVLAAGVVLMAIGLSLVTSELSPWQSGLIAGAVMALSAVPVYVHNLDLRYRHGAEDLPASDLHPAPAD